MDERYTIKSEYILEPIDIYPVYEKKYKDMYRLVGYRYIKQKCRCVYYLIERKEGEGKDILERRTFPISLRHEANKKK